MHRHDSSPQNTKPCLLVLATTYPRWANDHEPGFVHALCRRLLNQFDVVVVCPDAPGADASGLLDGVDVVRYRYGPRRLQTLVNDGGIASNLRRSAWKWALVPGFLIMQYVAARRVVRRRPVAVVHAHWLVSPGIVARLICGRLIPYVVTSHGGDLFGFRGGIFTSLKRWVADGSRAMSVVSRAMEQEARRLALPVGRIDVIPMGVDLIDRFAPDDTVIRSEDEVVFVGRLVEKKGLRYLLDAFPYIVEARPGARLRIVGFGPERASLEAQVALLGIGGHVTFEGAMEQQQLPAIYRRAAVFVAPFIRDASGDQEGLPVALMEAIATGCPFVVGDVQGLDDLLGASASVYRAEPRDTRALADAVISVLSSPGVAKRAAIEVRTRAASQVDWTVVANRYGELLRKAMKAGQS